MIRRFPAIIFQILSGHHRRRPSTAPQTTFFVRCLTKLSKTTFLSTKACQQQSSAPRLLILGSTIFIGAATSGFVFKPKMSVIESILQNSDQLFDQNQFQNALQILSTHEDQELSDIKWRQARAMYKLSKTAGKDEKEQLIRDGYALVSDAVTKDETNFAVHKWMAILLDANSELDGIKARVSQLETVKRHMERAVELNPDDPTSWHLLGNFAFGLADMPWYQRKIVSTIFATPPSGTYEEALAHFLKAEELEANFYSMNLLFIAKCYQALKNREESKRYLQQAASIRVLTEDDKRCQEEAANLLKKL